ncbi:CopG family transcriptional regulator, partial [Vibrio cholerae]
MTVPLEAFVSCPTPTPVLTFVRTTKELTMDTRIQFRV